jgi:hypothetical protein
MIFGAAIVAVGVFYFLVGDITSRSNAISDQRALIARRNDSFVAFVKIKQDFAEAAKYKTAMDKLLPMQNELINFPQWLQNIAAAYGVTANFSFTASTAPATPAEPGTVGFSLATDGNNSDVISFLKNLESQAPGFLFSFNSFNLTQNGNDTKVVTNGNMFFR